MNVDSLSKEKKNIEKETETLCKEVIFITIFFFQIQFKVYLYVCIQKNQAFGGKQELDNTIINITNELMVNRYKNAETNYLNEKVKLEVLNRVEKDLMKYNKAVEIALNKFHQDHMRSINIIIKKLWRSIYTGNDIDYIQISTSDINKPISTESSNCTFLKTIKYNSMLCSILIIVIIYQVRKESSIIGSYR